MKRTTDTTTATDPALASAAAAGDQDAFDELHRRHGAVAWRLALAITGDPDLATRAVADGTGTVFTGLRAGRTHARPHGVALLAATRNAALDLRRDGVTTSPAVADGADALLVGAFAALPERWRSVLWLRDAERQDAERIAPVVELAPEAVDQLAVRARRGLRERYLRAQAATVTDRSCTRAVARLGALDDGTLGARDAETLERHLDACPACTERRGRIAGLAAALPALAPAIPDDVHDRARSAWGSALAAPSRTGLSPRTEKVLAGASALAAAIGILGATVFGSGGDGEPTASPLAPLVADIETPRPVDLSDLALPLMAPAPVTGADALDRRRLPSATLRGTTAPSRIASPTAPSTDAAAPVPGAPAGPGTPAVEGPTSPAPQAPVGIDPEDGLTVGPVGVDLSPEDGTVLEVPLPEPLAPVSQLTDPLLGIVNPVLAPVVGLLQPVTDPLLGATEPVGDALGSLGGGLG